MAPFRPLAFLAVALLLSPFACAHPPSCRFDSGADGSGGHHQGGDYIHHLHDDGHRHEHQHHHGGDYIHHFHGDGQCHEHHDHDEIGSPEVHVGGFGHDHYHHNDEDHDELSPTGLWVKAMGCSLLVSLASLICLMILPVICFKGKPSKAVVDSLAVFGAGAMLGDAFLHQLPHAFGGGHAHAHEHHISNIENQHHEHGHGHGHSHSHSLEDLSVGLSVLCGIVLFLLVEKLVRYVEEHSIGGSHGLSHGHHHSHKKQHKLKDEDGDHQHRNMVLTESMPKGSLDVAADSEHLNIDKNHETTLRKRVPSGGSCCSTTDKQDNLDGINGVVNGPVIKKTSSEEASSHSSSSLIFGYLNLFSDGVHNFTDGMALGSAFLLHGSVGGWSRTLFLLAHELPQEIGDFGILVRSGFTISKALFFNFLSALVALAGTALALVLGKDPGQSSLIEGFTAGGFIYIAVAGVLPEMNSEKTTLKSTAVQVTSLVLGMAVALCISLVE